MILPAWIWNVVLALIVIASFLVMVYGSTHFVDSWRAEQPKASTVIGWMGLAVAGIGLTVAGLFAISLN